MNMDDYIIDPALAIEDQSSNKKIADLARLRVVSLFEQYSNERQAYAVGDDFINIEDKWDENYNLYKVIFDKKQHNYQGKAKVCMPVIRKIINTLESESSNALFSREDYFSTDGINSLPVNLDMARRAFQVMLNFSEVEDYVSQFELAKKQCYIYGATAGEVVFIRDEYEQVYRKMTEEPALSETGEQLYDQDTQEPITRIKIDIDTQTIKVRHPKVIARNIYDMYVNMYNPIPEEDDVIYRDKITAQDLLKLSEKVYNKRAVKEMLANRPGKNVDDKNNSGNNSLVGVDNLNNSNRINDAYEVLRFQGLFSTTDPETGLVVHEQYLIDIGERQHVLRCQKNPFIGKKKTFIFCNYDSMIDEFYTDGAMDTVKALQYEINDKENQSLDAIDFQLNAPYEVEKTSGLKAIDFIRARKQPNSPLFVRKIGSVKKLQDNINVSHLNLDLTRLNNYADIATGATAIAGGQPSGTQADRSGKALDLLQNQTRSQFSKFIRKFERRFLEPAMRLVWDMTLQFSDENVEIELFDEKSQTKSPFLQNVAEIVGQFNIKVQGGSQYLKERQVRDSIMEFVSVVSSWDVWREMVTPDMLLKDIASSSPHDLSKYVDTKNIYNKQAQQIKQMQDMMAQMQKQYADVGKENIRLTSELKQTDRSNMANPPLIDKEQISALQRTN